MKERMKKYLEIVCGISLIALWIGHELRLIPPLNEELRAMLSVPVKLIAAAIFSTIIFLPTLITISIPLGLLLAIFRIPEKSFGWIGIVISIALSLYLGYEMVFNTGIAPDIYIEEDCRPAGPGIYNDC